MKKILAFLLVVPAVLAQVVEPPTPMQMVWSVFAVATIVFLFAIYHLHLESKNKKRQ